MDERKSIELSEWLWCWCRTLVMVLALALALALEANMMPDGSGLGQFKSTCNRIQTLMHHLAGIKETVYQEKQLASNS